jgi:hypothetical protein
MCCEGLVCAACGGQVARAGCTTCRASRAQVHTGRAWTPELVAMLAALAVLALLLLR